MSNFIIKFSKVKMLSHFKGITKQLLLLIKELANLSFAMRREDVLNTLSLKVSYSKRMRYIIYFN